MSGVPASLPTTVIAGYLGAGKTTLVNHLLRNADGLRIAVLVNEFGELPIDADLIESSDGNVIDIAGGCICCSYGSDLMAAMMDLAERTPRPEHVLIETSGVAMPGPVAASLSLLPDYTLDGIVVLADAETVRRHGSDHYLADTIYRQLADADLVLLNKMDLVSEADAAETEAWIAERAPHARIVPTRDARLPLTVLLGSRLETGSSRAATLDLGSREHVAYDTQAFTIDAQCDADALASALTDPALGILRAKGFVSSANGRRVAIQIVGGRHQISPAPGDTTARDGLIVIGLKGRIDLATVAARIAEATGVTPPSPSAV